MNGSDTGHILFDIQVERVNRTDYMLTGNITFRSPFTKNPNAYYVSVCDKYIISKFTLWKNKKEYISNYICILCTSIRRVCTSVPWETTNMRVCQYAFQKSTTANI